jgi:TetR/AcrR family transcriptional regulator, cholesterol catabolism regulator
MPAAPSRPALRARYDRRHDAVVAKAAKVFASQGYDQTTMQEVASSMGLATGALYHYFSGKEQLLMAICNQLMDPLMERATALVAQENAPEAELRQLVRLWVEHVITHRDHMLVFQQERHLIEVGDRWRRVRANRKAFERLASGSLARAIGWTAPEEPLRVLALLGMVNHTAQWFRPRGHLTPEQIADGYVDLVLGGAPSPAKQ